MTGFRSGPLGFVSKEEEPENDFIFIQLSQFGSRTIMYIYTQVYRKPKELTVR